MRSTNSGRIDSPAESQNVLDRPAATVVLANGKSWLTNVSVLSDPETSDVTETARRATKPTARRTRITRRTIPRCQVEMAGGSIVGDIASTHSNTEVWYLSILFRTDVAENRHVERRNAEGEIRTPEGLAAHQISSLARLTGLRYLSDFAIARTRKYSRPQSRDDRSGATSRSNATTGWTSAYASRIFGWISPNRPTSRPSRTTEATRPGMKFPSSTALTSPDCPTSRKRLRTSDFPSVKAALWCIAAAAIRRTFFAPRTTSDVSKIRCGSSRCLFRRKKFNRAGSKDDRRVVNSSLSGLSTSTRGGVSTGSFAEATVRDITPGIHIR